MHFSEDNICTVVPSSPDKSNEALWPKVEEEVDKFAEEKDIDTLLLYFTCHGTKEQADASNQFQLGSPSDSINQQQFEELLKRLDEEIKLIMILDRCYPVLVKFKDRKFVQINSCKETEIARMNKDGSFFTKWFIQGLKAKSEPNNCAGDCKHCNDYWKRNTSFITVESLYDYIKGHLKENKKQTPVRSINLKDHDSNIAYYTGSTVSLDFFCCTKGRKIRKKVELKYLKDMTELKNKLKKEFERK